jgi:3-deoxy-D-manno-octulosonic-acid transferase
MIYFVLFKMMTILYNIALHVYYLLVLIASLFNPKARLWIAGRRGWRSKLRNWNPSGEPVIWFHAASLGEFEQGRPLIDKIRESHAGYRLLLTFYSPSGYEIRKNYAGADLVMYLPLDTVYNARLFVKLVRPVAVVFIKYEFWPSFLRQIQRSQHPVYLISAIFRPGQVFFKWYGTWFRKILSCITYYFVQDSSSAGLLNKIGISNCLVAGDTRFDRVESVARGAREIEIARKFSGGHNCLVAGSTWPEDEALLIRLINESGKQNRFIIAQHEISPARLNQLTSQLGSDYLLYSRAGTESMEDKQVLVIDNIGMLSSLYRYGRIAYIGGGFGKGIHNILEAAAFGIPVIFGPYYEKFREARELLQQGGAFSVTHYGELRQIMDQLSHDPVYYERAARVAGNYVQDNTGSTALILQHLFRNI